MNITFSKLVNETECCVKDCLSIRFMNSLLKYTRNPLCLNFYSNLPVRVRGIALQLTNWSPF